MEVPTPMTSATQFWLSAIAVVVTCSAGPHLPTAPYYGDPDPHPRVTSERRLTACRSITQRNNSGDSPIPRPADTDSPVSVDRRAYC